MKCPSCSGQLTEGAPACPSCGLTLQRLDQKFGAIPRHSTFLSDRTGKLGRQANHIRDRLRSFHALYPQSFFSVLLTNRISEPISEYVFWLANRGRSGKLDAVGTANFDLLLGIDIDRRVAAVVIGYGLEAYLSERDLERALAGASGAFWAGDYASGIAICVDLLSERMKSVIRGLEQAGTVTGEDSA